MSMSLPTVKLKHKTRGTKLIVNEVDWAQDLGKGRYSGYERVSERHNNAGDVLEVVKEPAAAEAAPAAESTPEAAPTPRRRTTRKT